MLLLLLRYCVACQLLCCSMICWRLFIIFREYSQQATEHTRLRYDVIIISFWLENSAESGTFHTKNIAHCFVHVRSIPQRYISYDLFAFLILGRTYYCQVTLLHLKSWDAWIVASGWFSD